MCYFIYSDVDECNGSNYDCGNGTCVNIPGSYICNCPPGYIFNLDERQCTGKYYYAWSADNNYKQFQITLEVAYKLI